MSIGKRVLLSISSGWLLAVVLILIALINIENKKVLIFGPKIPPIGGVSVHIDRVSNKYLNQNNKIKIFDATEEIISTSKIYYSLKILKLIKSYKPDIIDYHTSFLKYYIQELIILVLLKNFFNFKTC